MLPGRLPGEPVVPTMIDGKHAIAPSKVRIIDSESVCTGSCDFTKAAQDKNAKSLLIIRDPTVAVQDGKNGNAHRQHGQPYVGWGRVR
jgi:phosphatidylserine/phosphatidylglycerophosphate/cardiolipin synthase-like enzyme